MASPEQRNEPELEEMQRHNRAFAEAKYLGDVGLLRARYIRKCQNLKIPSTNGAWMYFRLDDDDGAGLATDSGRDLLIYSNKMAAGFQGRLLARPLLRILQSEAYPTAYGTEFLTTDVTIDHYAAARYIVDSITLYHEPPTTATIESLVPLFCVNENGMPAFTPNFRIVTRANPIHYLDADGTSQTMLPFGYGASLLDMQDALVVASELFDQVENMEPKYSSVTIGE